MTSQRQPSSARAEFVRCAWLVAEDGELLRDAGLWIGSDGRIRRVLAGERELAAAARECGSQPLDLGAVLLAPGFVDAHAHLELSALRGRVGAGASFTDWIGNLLRERARLSAAELGQAARAAADELLAGGTTLVADVDSLGLCGDALRGHALQRIPFHELLDARDPARTSAALERVRRALSTRTRLGHGLSPHAPGTNSAELLTAAARLARGRRARLMIHWAETPEEERWLEHGEGALAALLPDPPGMRGLCALERAGLLGTRTLLVHGNAALPAERARIAAAGASLVHCPGTHAFFDRPSFDLAAWRAAGVPLALGTDSLASNERLDLRQELALLARAAPGFERRELWLAATRGGARALGLGGRMGELRPGAQADFLVLDVCPRGAAEVWEALTSPLPAVRETWIRGRRVFARAGERGNAPRALDFRGPRPK